MGIARSARLRLVVGFFVFVLFQPDPGVGGTGWHFDAGEVSSLSGDDRVSTFSNKLKQNSDNRFRLVVADKCEEEGERELQRIAYDSELEESYVFLPSKCIWIELGSEETSTTVRSDASFVMSLVSNHEPIIVYHTHVGSQSEQSGGFPAYQDLIGSILIGGDVPLIEGRPIVHRAVTVDGIFEYSLLLTPEVSKLISTLGDTGLKGYVAQNLAYIYSGRAYREAYYKAVKSCLHSGDFRDNSGSDCFPMYSFPFRLNYPTADIKGLAGR